MTDPLNHVHREGDWIVATSYGRDYDTVDVKIAHKSHGGADYQKLDGSIQFVPNGERMPDEPTFRIRRDALTAVANGLARVEPASEQLVKSLSSSYAKEQERVDKLIEFITSSE